MAHLDYRVRRGRAALRQSATWDSAAGERIRASWSPALSVVTNTAAVPTTFPGKKSMALPAGLPPFTRALTGAGSPLVTLGYLSLPPTLLAQQTPPPTPEVVMFLFCFIFLTAQCE